MPRRRPGPGGGSARRCPATSASESAKTATPTTSTFSSADQRLGGQRLAAACALTRRRRRPAGLERLAARRLLDVADSSRRRPVVESVSERERRSACPRAASITMHLGAGARRRACATRPRERPRAVLRLSRPSGTAAMYGRPTSAVLSASQAWSSRCVVSASSRRGVTEQVDRRRSRRGRSGAKMTARRLRRERSPGTAGYSSSRKRYPTPRTVNRYSGSFGVRLDLLPQVADVDVDRARVAVGGVAPHAREQHVAREHAARASGPARSRISNST